MCFFQLILRLWLQSKPGTSMKSLGNFPTKQFCFQKMLLQKYLGFSFLTGTLKKPYLDLWCVFANPSPCMFPICNFPVTHLCPNALQSAVADGNAGTLRELLQSQKSQNFQFCAFEGISNWGVADPKGLGAWALCQ